MQFICRVCGPTFHSDKDYKDQNIFCSGVENSGAAQSPIYVDTSGCAASPIYVDASGDAPSPVYIETSRLHHHPPPPPADISSQPEFRRLGEIDLTVSDFMPMTSGHCTDEYLTMEGLSYQSRQPQDDYLDMERPGPHDDYLSMTPHLQDDYLAMSSSAENPDQFSKLTFPNS